MRFLFLFGCLGFEGRPGDFDSLPQLCNNSGLLLLPKLSASPSNTFHISSTPKLADQGKTSMNGKLSTNEPNKNLSLAQSTLILVKVQKNQVQRL